MHIYVLNDLLYKRVVIFIKFIYSSSTIKYVTRSKYPFEYELGQETLEKGEQWLTLWLKNEGEDKLHNLDIKMHSTDSLNISFRSPNAFVHLLNPNEEKFFDSKWSLCDNRSLH